MITSNQSIINFINKYGYLFEDDTLILLDDIKTDKKIKEIKEKYKEKKKKLENEHSKQLDGLKDYVKDVGKDYGKDLLDDLQNKMKSKASKIKLFYIRRMAMLGRDELKTIEKLKKMKSVSKKGAILISGLALATLLIQSSYEIYKTEKNNVIKKCPTKKGIEKDLCIKEIKIKALRKSLTFLNNAAIKCNYSKEPIKCKDKLNEEILKIREKLRDEGREFGKKMKIVF